MRKQYHFWPGAEGLDAWDVDRLIRLSRGLPAEAVPVDSIADVDRTYRRLRPRGAAGRRRTEGR